MTLSLGFSPCPNDCFMFDAIVNRRIDLEGLEFSTRLADVEELNRAAFVSPTTRSARSVIWMALLVTVYFVAANCQAMAARCSGYCSNVSIVL